MSVITTFWLKHLTTLADVSSVLYYTFLWLLAFVGVFFVLLFPFMALLSFGWLAGFCYFVNPINWQTNDWITAAILLTGTIYTSWISYYLFKLQPELHAGKPLDANSFPMLFELINELRSTYQSPEFHDIKLTTNFRIELVRTPTNGFPTCFTNTLLIGLPILTCMTPMQFKHMLARQIGHLSTKHRSYSRQLVHLRNAWDSYARLYAKYRQLDTIILRLFFSWYAPFFHSCSIPAVRLEAFAKDRLMLEITSAERAAEAIAVFEIKKRYLKTDFWHKLNEAAYLSANPPYLPYSAMSSIMHNTLDCNSNYGQNCYEAAINREIIITSELPNLLKRLISLGHENFVIPEATDTTAANNFLGEQSADLLKQMDNIWYLKNKNIWSKRYQQGLEEKRRLKSLRDQASRALLSNAEAREYLLLIDKYVDAKTALPLFKEILKTNSMDSNVCYEVGRLLLEADDEKGIDALKIAMDVDHTKTIDSCHHLIKFLSRHGNTHDAQQYRRMILQYQADH